MFSLGSRAYYLCFGQVAQGWVCVCVCHRGLSPPEDLGRSEQPHSRPDQLPSRTPLTHVVEVERPVGARTLRTRTFVAHIISYMGDVQPPLDVRTSLCGTKFTVLPSAAEHRSGHPIGRSISPAATEATDLGTPLTVESISNQIDSCKRK